MRTRPNPRIPALAGVATADAAAFAGLTILERHRRLLKQDEKTLQTVAPTSETPKYIAEQLHPLGKWYGYVPAAAAAGAVIYAKGTAHHSQRAAGAGALLLAAAASALVTPLFDKVLPQPPPPPARRSEPKPTFPSGHAFGLGAVALTAAYMLHHEQIIPPTAAAPLALLPPLVGGGAKIIEQKHWPSEVAAGFLAAGS